MSRCRIFCRQGDTTQHNTSHHEFLEVSVVNSLAHTHSKPSQKYHFYSTFVSTTDEFIIININSNYYFEILFTMSSYNASKLTTKKKTKQKHYEYFLMIVQQNYILPVRFIQKEKRSVGIQACHFKSNTTVENAQNILYIQAYL